jgi:hypothetical protein
MVNSKGRFYQNQRKKVLGGTKNDEFSQMESLRRDKRDEK